MYQMGTRGCGAGMVIDFNKEYPIWAREREKCFKGCDQMDSDMT